MALPNFLIIGAMKCGTSTVFENLRFHPSIAMSKYKETNFFSSNYHKYSLEWYESQFSDKFSLRGESTPSYSRRHLFPETTDNIYDTLKDVKIIYLVRDPILRIISHLHHDLYRDRVDKKRIADILSANSDYVLTSSYYYQIEPYIEKFGKDNILVLQFEEMISGSNLFFKKILKFLDLDDQYGFKDLKVRNHTRQKYLIRYHDLAHKFLPKTFIKPYHLLNLLVNTKIAKPSLSSEVNDRVKSYLQDDIDQFVKTFALKENLWNTFYIV